MKTTKSSCIVAQSADLPTLPWSGSGITCEGGVVTEADYQAAATNTLEKGLAAANKIGYPVMIKVRVGSYFLPFTFSWKFI